MKIETGVSGRRKLGVLSGCGVMCFRSPVAENGIGAHFIGNGKGAQAVRHTKVF